MLNCIESVRLGVIAPELLRRAERSRRALNLHLSPTAVMDPVFSSAVLTLDIEPEGRYLLSGLSDGSCNIHDTFNFTGNVSHTKLCVSQGQRRSHHLNSVRTVEWYPIDSGLFTTSSSDGKLHLWDANNSITPVDIYDLEEVITRHHVNPVVGNLIAACCDGDTNIIDIRVGTSIQVLPENSTKCVEVQWSPLNQHQLIVGSDAGHIIEWDIRSTLNYKSYGLEQVRTLRRSIRTRDLIETPAFLQLAHNGCVSSIRFSNNGLELFSSGKDSRIRRWKIDAEMDPCISTLHVGKKSTGHTYANYEIGLSGDTDPPVVFAPKGTSVMICDMNECVVKKELLGHFQTVNCFVYDNVFQQGYSGGLDSSVMVWSSNQLAEQIFLEESVKRNKRDELTTKRKLIDD